MKLPSCASWRRTAWRSPRRTCRRRERCRLESSHDPPHRGSDRARGVGHPGGRGSRQPAPDDDRASARRGDHRRGNSRRHPDRPQARRRLRAAPVRHPAGRRGAVPRIRARDRGRGGDGARGTRWWRARTGARRSRGTCDRVARRAHDQSAAACELGDCACRRGPAGIGRSARTRARPRGRAAARRIASGPGDHRRSRPRVVGSSAARRSPSRPQRSACTPARRGHSRGGAGGRRGGDVTPRGHGAQSEMVRRGARRRAAGGRVAPVRAASGRALLGRLAVQGSYNYERLLGVGVGVAEEPLLRDLGDGKYRPAVARGAHFFNAHPYLIGLAVGAAARAEHEGASPDQIERLREALCGPLGSLGDRLVWAGWLPLLSGLTIAGIALGAGWIAVAIFLIVYNIGHVALRWWALYAGWTHGARVSVALHSPMLQKAGALLGPAMAFAVGVALPLAARFLAVPFPRWGQLAAVVTAGLVFLALRWRSDRLNGLRVALGLSAVALIVGLIWQ